MTNQIQTDLPSLIEGGVDVIIPMRNGALTIPATIATVLSQTALPRRIIVVDDGSTDGGADLLQDYPLVEVIPTPPRGVSSARNTGIYASRAEFVAFLDSDDLWRQDKLERQLETARRHPEADIITCDHVGVDLERVVIPETAFSPRYKGRVFDRVLAQGFGLGGWSSSMLVRRDSIIESGCYDENLTCFEDLDLCLRLARDHVFVSCPELLVFIVENPASTMRRPKTPEQVIEISLQGLMVMERWIDNQGRNTSVSRQCAGFILSKVVRHGLSSANLREIRRQMVVRTPRLAQTIARSDLHLVRNLLVAGTMDLKKGIAAVQRTVARRRTTHRPGALGALSQQASVVVRH